jgi:cytochrome c-type biogenesis protein CcmH/NrfF
MYVLSNQQHTSHIRLPGEEQENPQGMAVTHIQHTAEPKSPHNSAEILEKFQERTAKLHLLQPQNKEAAESKAPISRLPCNTHRNFKSQGSENFRC